MCGVAFKQGEVLMFLPPFKIMQWTAGHPQIWLVTPGATQNKKVEPAVKVSAQGELA